MTYPEARELCSRLFLETLASLRVAPHLRKAMRLRNGILEIEEDSYPLSQFEAVRIVSFGKAACEMAETAAEILAGTRFRGIVVGPTPASQPLPHPSTALGAGSRGSDCSTRAPGLEYFEAAHPYPDERSSRAAEAVLAFLEKCSPRELVLFLISGGGSALLEKPLDSSISLEDLRQFYEVLVTCGASIEEINILRKHFSAVKGGRLAERASPATQVTLYVSDVPEHLPSAVASGPTMPDESTLEDCRRIADQYALLERFPASIRVLLEPSTESQGCCGLPETLKPGHPSFSQSRYYCLLSNRDGIEKLLELAKAAGVRAEADTRSDDWPLQQAADYLLARLDTLREEHPRTPVMLVSGGELSSPVTGSGRGGRNQAFVLHCVPKIAGRPVVVLSAGTDGIDGNSPAAGSLADGGSAGRAAALGMDLAEFLSRGDSYCFFEKLGDTIVTGPTGTNVRDLRVLLAY